MAWAATYKVVLGSVAFLIFWTLATFPAVRFLPVGRTAGALLGGTLMVVFQVLSPGEAFAAIDLPILGLLFGTMVVSVYLERAGMFKYLKLVLGWRCRGPKDLMVRVSVFSALASALFTNDTICVIFTEFVLDMCAQQGLPAEPFLLALASSANIGSATTPIGNPQNLIIAIESKIGFGRFLLGVLPAMAAGIVFNILFLLALYWKPLSTVSIAAAADTEAAPPPIEMASPAKPCPPVPVSASPGGRSPLSYSRLEPDHHHEHHHHEPVSPSTKTTQLFSSRVFSPVHPVQDKQPQLYSPRVYSPSAANHPHHPHHHLHHLHRHDQPSPGMSPAVTAAKFYSRSHPHLHAQAAAPSPEIREPAFRQSLHEHFSCEQNHHHEHGKDREKSGVIVTVAEDKELEEPVVEEKWWKCGPNMRRRAWIFAVYGVTAGFLAALLSGLNLTWSALTAAVALMVLDFSDAGPSLDKVSYSLLVFFSGMFITVDGFNRTGAPGQFWNAVEPHSRITSVQGIAILSLVVLVLSNVASNVPTVLLLGTRVAASAAATHGASVTKAWLFLAWISTVAGNFTLIGSAANLIVCEQARQAKTNSYNLTFWAHLKFGIPSTLIVTALGLPLIH